MICFFFNSQNYDLVVTIENNPYESIDDILLIDSISNHQISLNEYVAKTANASIKILPSYYVKMNQTDNLNQFQSIVLVLANGSSIHLPVASQYQEKLGRLPVTFPSGYPENYTAIRYSTNNLLFMTPVSNEIDFKLFDLAGNQLIKKEYYSFPLFLQVRSLPPDKIYFRGPSIRSVSLTDLELNSFINQETDSYPIAINNNELLYYDDLATTLRLYDHDFNLLDEEAVGVRLYYDIKDIIYDGNQNIILRQRESNSGSLIWHFRYFNLENSTISYQKTVETAFNFGTTQWFNQDYVLTYYQHYSEPVKYALYDRATLNLIWQAELAGSFYHVYHDIDLIILTVIDYYNDLRRIDFVRLSTGELIDSQPVNFHYEDSFAAIIYRQIPNNFRLIYRTGRYFDFNIEGVSL